MRRLFRRHRKQVEDVRSYAGTQFEANFFNRFVRLFAVRRFVIGWVLLLVILPVLTAMQTVNLNQHFLASGPVPGGVYDEGMVGSYSTASPLFATSKVDASVSKLVFSGLFKYDTNNSLVGDLATGYELDDSSKVYTVHLRDDVRWHDGFAFSADDVVFTYGLMQNADVGSPFFSSWQGISVKKVDDATVTFTLSNILTSFPYSLTGGIVPKHILEDIPASQVMANRFNASEPIGTGPFRWDALQIGSNTDSGISTDLIKLLPNEEYYGDVPKLASFIIHTYESREQLITAFQKRSIIAMAGLESIPEELSENSQAFTYRFPLTAATMVFFKTSDGITADKSVRTALELSVNQLEVLRLFDYQVEPVRGPLLKGQLGYAKQYNQAPYDLDKARDTLDKAGWVYEPKKDVRSKDGVELRFRLTIEDTPENQKVARFLSQSWKVLGADVQIIPQIPADFQATASRHDYNAILHTISIGVDPDVFVYWDSAEADVRSTNRLNFSEYSSDAADTALESGRTRVDPAVRATKYEAFQKEWQKDVPAIALYQPNDIYITRGQVAGLTEHPINADSDRYYSVSEWQIKSGQIPK